MKLRTGPWLGRLKASILNYPLKPKFEEFFYQKDVQLSTQQGADDSPQAWRKNPADTVHSKSSPYGDGLV